MTTTKKLTIAAAVAAIAASVAQAQVMRAEIPFAFRAGTKVMAPGTYEVQVKNDGRGLVILSNFAAKQAAALVPAYAEDAEKKWVATGQAVLAFECGAGRCELSRVWTGHHAQSYSLPHHNIGPSETASLMLIPLVKRNTE